MTDMNSFNGGTSIMQRCKATGSEKKSQRAPMPLQEFSARIADLSRIDPDKFKTVRVSDF
jgi:hypothetical protein